MNQQKLCKNCNSVSAIFTFFLVATKFGKNENVCKNCSPTASSLSSGALYKPIHDFRSSNVKVLDTTTNNYFLGFSSSHMSMSKQAGSPECCWSEREQSGFESSRSEQPPFLSRGRGGGSEEALHSSPPFVRHQQIERGMTGVML